MNKLLAYHLDLKRAMPLAECLDRDAARLAGWGFNSLLLEIEDKFRFRNHPDLAHPSAPSREDMIRAVASMKGLEIIPLVQTLGHAECVLAKPGYKHLRESPEITDQYDPLSSDARRLIFEMIDETVEAFRPPRYFHIGGDETPRLGQSPKCQELVAEIGVGGLYLQHMLPIIEHVLAKGLRPIIWSDILLAHPEILDRVPRDVVIAEWNYVLTSMRPRRIRPWGLHEVDWLEYQKIALAIRERLDPFAIDERTHRDGTFRGFFYVEMLESLGFDVITCSASRCNGDSLGIPDHTLHVPNVFHFAKLGNHGHIVTSWAVRRNHPECGWPAVFAASPAAQHLGSPESVRRAFTTDFYGADLPAFGEALTLAAQDIPFGSSKFSARALRNLNAGHDPFRVLKDDLDAGNKNSRLAIITADTGDAAAELQRIKKAAADFHQAQVIFESLVPRATKNQGNFAYWIEGIELMIFHADFDIAGFEGTLEERAPEFLSRLEELEARTRELFARSYALLSLDEELDARYKFPLHYLKKKRGVDVPSSGKT